MAMAAEIEIPQDSDQWRYISWGALLHDVGKIAIADGILRKPSNLTDGESMRTHAQAGFDILRSVDFLAPAGGSCLRTTRALRWPGLRVAERHSRISRWARAYSRRRRLRCDDLYPLVPFRLCRGTGAGGDSAPQRHSVRSGRRARLPQRLPKAIRRHRPP